MPIWQKVLAGLCAFGLAWSLRYLPVYLGGDVRPAGSVLETAGRAG